MKIAICDCGNGFEAGWMAKCNRDHIPFSLVDPYDSEIILKLKSEGITHFLWHWHHSSPKDWLFARQLLISIQDMGIKVFPDINTCWHFDDKVGQKYLMEANNLPLVATWVFYGEIEALDWAKRASWPKVFKLRAGAGSKNVMLVKSFCQAKRLIHKMFSSGFPTANVGAQLSMTAKIIRKDPFAMLKKVNRIPHYISGILSRRALPRQSGYCLFQEFVDGNLFDTRIVVVGGKAIGIRRKVRENDFRASGSGIIDYNQGEISIDCVRIAFEAAKKIKMQSLALDFVMTRDGQYKIIEISYGFAVSAYYKCPGYWDRELKWHDARVRPEEWILEDLLQQ